PFMAHGYCFLWKPALVGLHAGSDLLIALAYYSIPLLLVYFVRRRQDVPFQGIFLLFSAFILSCGTGHLLEVWTLWHPDYWLSGLIKAITAIVSLYTASEMVPLIPKALALPSPAQLEAANVALEKEIAEHKQTVAALKQSQQRLSLLVQQTPLAVIEWNLEGEVSEWNPAAERIFGYDKGEAIGHHATELMVPGCAKQQFNQVWQTLLASEGGSCSINKHYTLDGRTVFCEWHNIPLIESNDSCVGVASLVQDITQRKEAEDALHRVNEQLEQRVEERTKELASANEELQAEMSDRLQAELALAERERYLAALVEVQRRLLALKGEENDYTSILELLGRSSNASHVSVFEHSRDASNQSLLNPCYQWCAPELYTQSGNHAYQYFPYQKCLPTWIEQLERGEIIVGQSSDFPESERLILEPMGILSLLILPLSVTEQFFGFIIFSNTTEAKVWSASEVDLLSAAAAALSLQHERSKAELALRRSEAQLREQATELEQTLYKLKQAQAQLVQSEKMSSLGMMVAGIAHEINNPVCFVYGNLTPAGEYIEELLEVINLYRQHYPIPVPEIQDYIETVDLDFLIEDLPELLASMKVGAERIRDIVATLRTFSRLDQAEMKRVNLHEGLDSTLVILQHRLKGKLGLPAIEVIKKYGSLPVVECYAGQLNQVFMNILANAIDALESKRLTSEPLTAPFSPRIEICTEVVDTSELTEDSKSVIIRIKDNGSGMTERVMHMLFDPFFTTKPVGQGTGLGLSISYQIVVAEHGGRLECVSAPGQGTEFIIEIPIVQPKRQTSTNGHTTPKPHTLMAINLHGYNCLEPSSELNHDFNPLENNSCSIPRRA
ncbi:MAG: PAS domain S-box protein, partial [Coleofasciculus sp. Co-bin14]|nr:PAS domain S-box protein [Coleofasciculus sp. Co-bin14]